MTGPHDSIFKQIFSQPQHAEGELRHVLPPELSQQVDWNSLRLEPGSFVDPKLAQRHTDLLYSARIGGRRAFVYFLFEHKASAGREVLFQLGQTPGPLNNPPYWDEDER